VSRWTTGVNGSNSSADSPSISGDGRFIAFRGNAIDYVPGATDYVPGIVIYDRQSGQFEALDLGQNTYGIMGANSPSIDSDGRFVTFLGYVPPLSSEILSEIFRYDRQTGDLALVSSAVGGGLGDRASDSPSISADGNLITFASMASNLSAVNTFGCPSIYVRNMASDSATLVSLNADGAAGRGNSQVPVISADGSAVAFASNARNLVPQDGNGLDDAFVASTGSAALGALTPSGVANCTGIAIGDINCDGEVTLSDALDLIKFFAGVKPYAECRFIGSPSMCGPGFTLFVAWKILMHVVDPTYDMGCNFK
jgi:Tol biopolymer transport system component